MITLKQDSTGSKGCGRGGERGAKILMRAVLFCLSGGGLFDRFFTIGARADARGRAGMREPSLA